MSQFVGGGPAELEQRADVSDADQLVGVSSSLASGFRFKARQRASVTCQQSSPFRYTGGRHDYDGKRRETGNQYHGDISQ